MLLCQSTSTKIKEKEVVVTDGGLCFLQALEAADFKRRDANDLCVPAGLNLFQAQGTLELWGKDRKA